jgi:uncharacterized membrane protein
MNVVVWVVQGLLAFAFAFSGINKLTQPREKLIKNMPYIEDFSTPQVRGIGSVEVLGALGLILPAATGIAPILTPIAATGLALVMVLAATVHLRRGETSAIGINAVLLILAAFVAWARFGPYAL